MQNLNAVAITLENDPSADLNDAIDAVTEIR
jgi:hypothetical protein